MKSIIKSFALYLLSAVMLVACSDSQSPDTSGNHLGNNTFLVKTQQEYLRQLPKLKPGDSLVLAKGEWRDFQIEFAAEGSEGNPIQLTAEEKGKVTITGRSNLKVSGNHLHVSGLVFKDGYSPTGEVISFRSAPGKVAKHTRISEVVIDNFNNPERFNTEYWVMMYGKHNRFDHNHIEGKRTVGMVMAVRLTADINRENYHRIDHNYFGPRPLLGSNGGETIRVGTSHTSHYNSHTTIENNYFDQADGELEIISIKSQFNTVRGNVFFESAGTLTLRHGNNNTVVDNIFFGNGKAHTGGIRLINARQVIKNNYMEGLKGYRFGGALVVMNGVPNSPPTRYHQVKDSFVENNSLVNIDAVQLAAGADQERSETPENTSFKKNLVFHQQVPEVFTIYDDVSGINFEGNVTNTQVPAQIAQGFRKTSVKMKREANGLLYPVDHGIAAGVSRSLSPVKPENVGTPWYPKRHKIKVKSPSTIAINPEHSLKEVIKSAADGDIITLAPGIYTASTIIDIDKAITLMGSSDSNAPSRIRFERSTLFRLQNKGQLFLKHLHFTGKFTPDSTGNAVIRTARRALLHNYNMKISHCHFSELDKNRSFNVLYVNKGTMAENIEIRDSNFKNVSGAILKLDAEKDDYGIYNADYVTIANSKFTNIQGAIADLYRGGTDESTFGPHLTMKNNELINVGYGKKNTYESSLYLHGVQVALIKNNDFISSRPIVVEHTVAEPITKIINNRFIDTPPPNVREMNSDKANTALLKGNEVTIRTRE